MISVFGSLIKVLQVVDLIEIEFISHAHNLGGPHIGAGEKIQVGEGDPSALGQDRDLPRMHGSSRHPDKGNDKTVLHIDHPQSIGPDDPYPPFSGNREEFSAPAWPLPSEYSLKPPVSRMTQRIFFLSTGLQDSRHGGRWGEDDRHIDPLLEIIKRGDDPFSVEQTFFFAHQKDLSLESETQGGFQRSPWPDCQGFLETPMTATDLG